MMEVIVEQALGGLSRHRAAWDELARHALDDNFYLSYDFLVATLRAHGEDLDYRIVFVYRAASTPAAPFAPSTPLKGEAQLVGVAAFDVRSASVSMPMRVLQTLETPHGYLSHPLVDREHAEEAWQALAEWMEGSSHPWRAVCFRTVPEDSRIASLLQAELAGRGRRVWEHDFHPRAILKAGDSFETRIANLSKSLRSGVRRRWRQLEEAYAAEVVAHRGAADPRELADRFMRLEALGWKGEEGTALACSEADEQFFRELVSASSQQSQVAFIEIRADGEPIAMTANFLQGRTFFAFKVAYDPSFSKFSPGIIAEVESLRFFCALDAIERADSGTSGPSYIDPYWDGSTRMLFLYWPTHAWGAGLMLRLVEALTELRRAIRGNRSMDEDSK